jgi:hypothetical protein
LQSSNKNDTGQSPAPVGYSRSDREAVENNKCFTLKTIYFMIRTIIFLLLIGAIYSCTNTTGSNAKTVSKKKVNTAAGPTKLDTSFTGFRIATILEDTKIIFTANGREDEDNTEPTTGFFIQGFTRTDNKAAEENIQAFVYNRTHNENVLSTENEKIKMYNTSVGKAIITTVTLKYKNNQKAFATTAIVSNGKNAILFVGEDYTDGGDYTDKFKSTFDSIEF